MSEASNDIVSPADVLSASAYRNNGTHNVYLLGCYESRVTILTQQYRALNLVDALFRSERLKRGSTVAVIGGGIGGITAAGAAGLAGGVRMLRLR
jgi:hypothetical protein